MDPDLVRGACLRNDGQRPHGRPEQHHLAAVGSRRGGPGHLGGALDAGLGPVVTVNAVHAVAQSARLQMGQG